MSATGPAESPTGAGWTEREDGPERITIAIVDDHRVVRAGLRMLLDAQADLEVVAEADDVAQAERRLAGYRPRVLVLDVNLAGGSSVPAIPRMRAGAPDTAIVVLTMHDDAELAREALRAGAIGFVLKEAAEDELIAAVRFAAAGRTYLTPELGARLATELPAPTGAPDDLSARELEVLRLIALGHTNREVAAELFLSVRTVESHRSHIQQKARRSSRAQLVAYAREHGVV